MLKLKNRFNFTGNIFLLLLVLILGAVLVYRKIGIKPKATAGVPRLTYSIEPANVNANQNFDLVLKINPNNSTFYAFELYTSYDPGKVDFQNTADLSQNITSNYLLTNRSVDSTANLITIVGTRTGSAFTGSTDQEIARVKLKVKSGATGDLLFNWGTNTKLAISPIEKVNGSFTVGGGVPLLFIDVPSVPPDPATGVAAVQKGQNVDVEVLLSTAGKQVKSIDAVIPYDDSRLTFQNTSALVQNIVINPSAGFDTQFVLKNVDTSQKKITIGMTVPSANQNPTPVQGDNILLATIKFVIKTDAPDGVIGLIPETTASNIYDLQTVDILGCVGGFKLTVGQGAVNTPTPTTDPNATDTPTPTQDPNITNSPTPTTDPNASPTPTGTPITITPQSVVLNLKIKFQGILSKPNIANNLPVKITVNSLSSSVTRSVTASFSVNNSGVWSGQAVFNNLPQGSDYKVFVKGPKHLQKRICERTPQETFPGSYGCENGSITLNTGTNNLNFSGILLMVGDLPQQDGLVNSYDISLVRNNIGVAGSQDPAVLALADLNLDGIVDSQDYSLVIAALSIRADEGP